MFTSYELALHSEIQAKLHAELCEAFPDPKEALSFEKLEKLPYLDGVCKEGLRIHAPIPSFLERIAPEGGLNICGYPIPAGTIVGMQGYTNHRNEHVYPNAEAFMPERWFEPTAEMKLNFLAFSTGPRACIGMK
jgi:cytochrome P450